MAKILLVDDNPLIRHTLCQILERKGHQVVDAEDGLEGIYKFKEHLPDLVITDLIMPIMDGLSMIQQILRDFPDAKIIAVSGNGAGTSDRLFYLATELGALAVLEKPISPDELFEAIDQCLKEDNLE